jgi:hypothetical protein
MDHRTTEDQRHPFGHPEQLNRYTSVTAVEQPTGQHRHQHQIEKIYGQSHRTDTLISAFQRDPDMVFLRIGRMGLGPAQASTASPNPKTTRKPFTTGKNCLHSTQLFAATFMPPAILGSKAGQARLTRGQPLSTMHPL